MKRYLVVSLSVTSFLINTKGLAWAKDQVEIFFYPSPKNQADSNICKETIDK